VRQQLRQCASILRQRQQLRQCASTLRQSMETHHVFKDPKSTFME